MLHLKSEREYNNDRNWNQYDQRVGSWKVGLKLWQRALFICPWNLV